MEEAGNAEAASFNGRYIAKIAPSRKHLRVSFALPCACPLGAGLAQR